MADRQEFPKSVRRAILKRAKTSLGFRCEHCCANVVRGEVHHLTMDAMKVDKSKPLTAEDGAFWCDRCHNPETGRQRKVLAKAIAQEDGHIGLRPPAKIHSRGFAAPAPKVRSDRIGKIDYSELPFGKGR